MTEGLIPPAEYPQVLAGNTDKKVMLRLANDHCDVRIALAGRLQQFRPNYGPGRRYMVSSEYGLVVTFSTDSIRKLVANRRAEEEFALEILVDTVVAPFLRHPAGPTANPCAEIPLTPSVGVQL